MRPVFSLTFILITFLQGVATAQVGLNNISISTTSEGNISWNANVDGHHRKGYFDPNMLPEVCKSKPVDKDVLIPQTIQSYPSPATDMLFFTGTGYDHFTVTIKDDEGKTMTTEK